VTEDPLFASRRELDAARHLLEGGFLAQSVSRSYFAAFRAAKAALDTFGETRSKHTGVIAEFGRHLVKEEGMSQDAARILALLFEGRQQADYAEADPAREDAVQAIEDAERFVDAVAKWLEGRASSQPD
jgi:uncharacterized protein (UPF0332 family)